MSHVQDEDNIEVFDEWVDAPGLSVVSNGQSSTRSERLMTWAESMASTVALQRAELRRTRMDLFQAEEEARNNQGAHEHAVDSLVVMKEVFPPPKDVPYRKECRLCHLVSLPSDLTTCQAL